MFKEIKRNFLKISIQNFKKSNLGENDKSSIAINQV